jgi:hypothetical protein
MVSQMPGGRARRALTLLGLIVLIVHCRPWSYRLFEDAPDNTPNAKEEGRHGRDRDALQAAAGPDAVAGPSGYAGAAMLARSRDRDLNAGGAPVV